MQVYKINMKTGIQPSQKFQEKQLASFAVNIGIKCGNNCLYCSTGALMFRHPAFKQTGQSPHEQGYALVDPNTPERVARDAKRMSRRGLIQLCTIVDAWSDEARQDNLGRRCMEAILSEPGWTIRILTKNAAVEKDFDLVEKNRERVMVGLSLTGIPGNQDIHDIIEPHASSIEERIRVLQHAHRRGIRTYGMLCPLIPGIAADQEHIDFLVKTVESCGAEEIFAEPVNARGKVLPVMQKALMAGGFQREASEIGTIRNRERWSLYVTSLIRKVQKSMREHSSVSKLRFLLYSNALLSEHLAMIRKDDEGIIWLGGKDAEQTSRIVRGGESVASVERY